eukprot:Opistho-2@67608
MVSQRRCRFLSVDRERDCRRPDALSRDLSRERDLDLPRASFRLRSDGECARDGGDLDVLDRECDLDRERRLSRSLSLPLSLSLSLSLLTLRERPRVDLPPPSPRPARSRPRSPRLTEFASSAVRWRFAGGREGSEWSVDAPPGDAWYSAAWRFFKGCSAVDGDCGRPSALPLRASSALFIVLYTFTTVFKSMWSPFDATYFQRFLRKEARSSSGPLDVTPCTLR